MKALFYLFSSVILYIYALYLDIIISNSEFIENNGSHQYGDLVSLKK